MLHFCIEARRALQLHSVQHECNAQAPPVDASLFPGLYGGTDLQLQAGMSLDLF